MRNLENKVGIITGASRGIGAAIAKHLATAGANLVLNYQSNEEKANLLRDEIRALGSDAICVQANVAQHEDASLLVEAALETYGRVDFLVNNAGITRDRSLRKMNIDDWDEVIRVNLNSVYNCSKAIIPYITKQASGSIINISSIIGQTGGFGQANYSAAKSGIIGFTKSAALELAKYGVTVNAICPGFIETEMLATIPPVVKDEIISKIPLAKLGSVEDIAKGVHYLLVDGQYITGQCLNINGGLYM